MAANMTFKADLLPNTDLGYSLGSSNKRWNIYGSLFRYTSSDDLTPTINYRSNNKDVCLFQVGHATSATGDFSNHYKLIYKGTGSSPNNYLQLIANNATTDTVAIQINENGNVSFPNTISASISGNAATATKLETARTIDGVSFDGSAAIIHYGVCGTGASTAAKTVSITGFTLVTGAIAYVKFTTQNSAASPTLNINGTGAIAIYKNGARAVGAGLTTDITYELLYDGTYYQIINNIKPRLGTCSTKNSTAAKTATCPGFILYNGATATIRFTISNSAATPTMNINGTGAKPILFANATSVLAQSFCAYNNYTLMYDGTQYQVIDQTTLHYYQRGVSAVADVLYTQEEYDAYIAEHGEPPEWNVGDVKTEGTAATDGYDIIGAGNATASNTNGGMTGRLRLYGTGTKYIDIIPNQSGSNGAYTHYLPQITGYSTTVASTPAETMGSWTAANYNVYSGFYLPLVNNVGVAYATDVFRPRVRLYSAASSKGYSCLDLGNNIPQGTAKNCYGEIRIYGTNAYYTALNTTQVTANNTVQLPGYNGTAYLTHVANATAVGNATTPTYVAANGRISLADAYSTLLTDTSWVGGTTDGPTLSITVGGTNKTATIPSAAAGASGIVTTTTQQFDGNKTFKGNIYPQATGTYDIGSSSLKWNTIYATTFNGNAASADKLSTARTLWGQSFDGTANVSGSMTDVGPQLKLPSGQTDFQFLTSGNGAANGKFGRLGLADSYANIDLTNYRLDVYGGSQRITTGFILFNNSADGALLKNKYSSTEYNLIRNHNNGNISISASSSGLYMGYENTTFINWKNGAMQLTTDNKLGIGTTSPSQKLHVDGGLVAITNNNNTVTIGSQNSTYTHIYNSADIPFIFNKDVNSASKNWLGSTSYPWGGLRLGGTAEIQYQGTKANCTMIRMIDNTVDGYGNGIAIGGGGQTIIGGGESAGTIAATLSKDGGEIMYVANDGDVNIFSNVQNGFSTTYYRCATLDTSARFTVKRWDNDGETGVSTYNANNGYDIRMIVNNGATPDVGLYSTKHGMWLIRTTKDKYTYLPDGYTGAATRLAFSQAGLAASAITWLTCWNGYELRAISKAEMANAVDSAHKWVRIGGDTMTGQLLRSASTLGGSWIASRDNGAIGVDASDSTASTAYTLARIKFSTKTYAICSERAGNNFGIYGWLNSRTANGTDWSLYINNDTYFHCSTRLYGAVWNDYAEKRNVPEAQETGWRDEESKANPLAGRCVCEVGDDTMVLTTTRLQKGCKIISDTFGFSIGETETAKTPIAVSGRALVYLYEDKEEAKQHIGDFVCSGPNGTVSIMTTEEYFKCPQAVVGTISAIPDYEEWGTGKVKVNGRIWIYVR